VKGGLNVPLEQHLEQTQKLVLNQVMQQSLHCLQLSALELSSYLQEEALSNPFLDLEDAPPGEPETEEKTLRSDEDLPIDIREQMIWDAGRGGNVSSDAPDSMAALSHPQSFTDYLNSQLGQQVLLNSEMLSLCRYLVGCLNSAGYLDCPLQELAEELHVPVFYLEQALYAVQSLDPPGVGARSLSECLLLQLAQGKNFSAVNIHLVQAGLPLLAEGDYAGLVRLLGVQLPEVQRAVSVIRSLNPIPSRGFYTEDDVEYILPEAIIRRDRDHLVVEMNERALPRISLNRDYCALVGNQDFPDAQDYLREKMIDAKNLLSSVQNRRETLSRVLSAIVERQRGYFLHGDSLRPMTMRQLSDQLQLSTSTVSRAVREKSVQFNGRSIPLRRFFTASLQTTDGQAISADAARQQLQRFISAEDAARPLSDEALSQALSGCGIQISRRTVAKYRAELKIAAAGARKRASG